MANKKTVETENHALAVADAPMQIQTAATRELTPGIWRMITDMAPVMYKAHLFGVQSPEQAAAIMLKGYDCGFSITASFDFIQVIQGKPSVNPRGAMALLLGSVLVKTIDLIRLADGKGTFLGYECRMERVNGFSHTARFTLEDAQRAGLMKPDSGWQKYPENMCMWRAIGFAADVVFPDVTAGMTSLMKAPEMYGVALSESGDVIDATSQPVQSPVVDPLNELIGQYGAEKILMIYGSVPVTPEQVADAREQLEQATKEVG